MPAEFPSLRKQMTNLRGVPHTAQMRSARQTNWVVPRELLAPDRGGSSFYGRQRN